MPTFLENIVGNLGGSLDDKARTALLQLDGVNAVSILNKLESRGEEVRNPSAFVAKAVSTASSKGPGQDELRCALEQLKKDGLIDDKAVDIITQGKAGFPDICTAVSEFLSREESSVRNPSAYITRSINNASSNGQPGYHGGYVAVSMYPGGFGYPAVVPGQAVMMHSIANHPMMRMLDDSAQRALESAGYDTASAILAELQSKGQEIRNPSAYVLKSATNALKGIGAAASATAGYYEPPPHSYAPPPIRYLPPAAPPPPRNGGVVLDERANAALSELLPSAAAEVWRQFEAVKATVRNPSAYITRAVENYWKGKSEGASAAVALEPQTNHLGSISPVDSTSNQELIAPWLGSLDENAVSALRGADAQVVASCLAELESKLGSVRNPSAYVVRSISNAKRQASSHLEADEDEQAARDLNEELRMLPSPLDDKASAALEEVGSTAALVIVQKMKNSGTVGNPSAYVMKAVQNHKQTSGIRPLKRHRGVV